MFSDLTKLLQKGVSKVLRSVDSGGGAGADSRVNRSSLSNYSSDDRVEFLQTPISLM